MQIQTAYLEETLRFKEPEPHELRDFFQSRNIQLRAVAQCLGVSYEAIRRWLNGYDKPTRKRETQLQALKEEVLRLEAIKGHRYDAKEPVPVRKAIKK